MDEIDAGIEQSAPVFAVFGDLMAGLLGAFVLILVGVLGVQMALAVPLATGRVTLNDGRIGISGSVLFALNSDDLQAEGRQVLESLAPPLAAYLAVHDEMLMISGFTDDRPVRDSNRRFADNWELSAQRALTVTRALIDEGIPPASIFAAAFGAWQPVASNTDTDGRSRNRRVEMAPVPKSPAQRAAPHE